MRVTVDNASVSTQGDRIEIGIGDCGMTYSTFAPGAARVIGLPLIEAAKEVEDRHA